MAVNIIIISTSSSMDDSEKINAINKSLKTCGINLEFKQQQLNIDASNNIAATNSEDLINRANSLEVKIKKTTIVPKTISAKAMLNNFTVEVKDRVIADFEPAFEDFMRRYGYFIDRVNADIDANGINSETLTTVKNYFVEEFKLQESINQLSEMVSTIPENTKTAINKTLHDLVKSAEKLCTKLLNGINSKSLDNTEKNKPKAKVSSAITNKFSDIGENLTALKSITRKIQDLADKNLKSSFRSKNK